MRAAVGASGAAIVAVACLATAAHAQYRQPRTVDYVFITGASDARALWVNPAGLAIIPEASILGEIVVERPVNDDTRLAQWTLGLNSRGFGLSYRSDKFPNDAGMGTLRFGIGMPFTRGTLGVGFSWYRVQGDDARDFDIGAMYGVAPSLNAAAVIRHIGRPTVNGVALPITFAGGLHWSGVGGAVQLQAEGLAAERLAPGDAGFDMGYRAGGIVSIPRLPVTLLATVDFNSSIGVDRLHFGIAFGGRDNVTLVGTGEFPGGDPRLATASVTGVASNLLLGQR